MSRPITVGTAGNRAFFRILDQDGNPWTARAFNAAGLSIYYLDTTTGALVSLTPTVSTWVERPGGWYALEVPDSVYATAIRSLIFGGVITGGTVWGEVQDVVPVVQTKAQADDDQDAIIATVGEIKAVTDLITETRLAKLDRDLASVADVSPTIDFSPTIEPTPVTVEPTPVTVNPTPVTVNPTPVTVNPTVLSAESITAIQSPITDELAKVPRAATAIAAGKYRLAIEGGQSQNLTPGAPTP